MNDPQDREYDGHDADECYACDGTGEVDITAYGDGAGYLKTVPCDCPCHNGDDS